METKTITLEKYTEKWICHYAEMMGMDAAEEAKEVLSNPSSRKDAILKFKRFAETFCDDRNRMNKGVYKFVVATENEFTYTIS